MLLVFRGGTLTTRILLVPSLRSFKSAHDPSPLLESSHSFMYLSRIRRRLGLIISKICIEPFPDDRILSSYLSEVISR